MNDRNDQDDTPLNESTYDKWFRQEVEQALKEADDPSTVWIPHEVVKADWQRQRKALLERIEASGPNNTGQYTDITQVNGLIRPLEGELVDEDAELLALHAEAMQCLHASFDSADRRVTQAFEDVRTLSRALMECMEIRTLKKRQEFVLSVFKKLNSRGG